VAATSEDEEMSVSTDQFHREGVGDKFHFDLDCTAHDLNELISFK
jgi:hypothetical protein